MTFDRTKSGGRANRSADSDAPITGDDATMLSDPPPGTHPSQRPSNPPPGMRAVSDFAVMEMVGQGGMGEVYAARDKKLFRNVAVKRLHDLLASEEKHRRGFLAEAVITGKLAHPNIVPIYSIVDEADNLAIAMKLIEGRTLQEIVKSADGETSLAGADADLKAMLEILISVCDAVRFAHSLDIIHRDIKPGNVMVGEFGEVLLLDWGLAVSTAEDPSQAARDGLPHCSEIRSIEGTLQYMPREMLLIDTAHIGIRTDVYLLGGMLYEILAGKPPHAGRKLADPLGGEGDTPPPLPDSLDREIREICAKALMPSPSDRFEDVHAFQSALHDFLRHGESRAACKTGRALLQRAQEVAAVPTLARRTEVYDLFAGAVFSFASAKELWANNKDAATGERDARLGYAKWAAQFGDFGLALQQLSSLEGEGVEAERREIALRERAAQRAARAGQAARKIAASAVLLGVVSAVLLLVVFFGAADIGKQAAVKTKIRLEREGRAQMERIVRKAAAKIKAEKQLTELALRQFIYLTKTEKRFDPAASGELPPQRVVAVERELEEITTAAAPLALKFLAVSATGKTLMSYPPGTAVPYEDPTPADSWFAQVKQYGRFIHTPPKPDPATGRMLSAAAAPVFSEEGQFLGAAAMFSDLRDVLGGMAFPESWGKAVKTEVVVAGGEEAPNGIVVYFSMDDIRRAGMDGSAGGLLTIRPADAAKVSKIRQDAQAGRTGVTEFVREGIEVVAGYTSLPGTRGQVMVTVPKTALTALADTVEANILTESRKRLVAMAAVAAVAFFLLLIFAFVLFKRFQ